MTPEGCDAKQVLTSLSALATRDLEATTIALANPRSVSADASVTTCEADYETTPNGLSGTVRYVIELFASPMGSEQFNRVPLEGGFLDFQGEGFAVVADWQHGSDT